jgi:hypothetical protein
MSFKRFDSCSEWMEINVARVIRQRLLGDFASRFSRSSSKRCSSDARMSEELQTSANHSAYATGALGFQPPLLRSGISSAPSPFEAELPSALRAGVTSMWNRGLSSW